MRKDALKEQIILVVGVGLIFLTVSAFWLESKQILQHTSIFYWPFGANILFWLRCIPLPIAFISIIIWASKHWNRLKKPKYFGALSISLLLLLGVSFSQFLGLMGASSVRNIGTIQFQEKIYHVAEVSRYDDRSEYFLGSCDSTRYWCEFHQIFILNALNTDGEVEFSANSDHISLMFYGKEVYQYDGFQEICIENDVGFCIEN